VFHGTADGLGGVFIERFGPGATLIRHEGAAAISGPEAPVFADAALALLSSFGVRAVYHKPFARDRSGGASSRLPVLTDANPIAGEPLPASIVVREHGRSFEIRLFDGFSVGLFLDQRLNRSFLADFARGGRVLNLFAYTGGFSVGCALAGASTTTVDISARYLDWARRNFVLNGLDAPRHHFARLDARSFVTLALRKRRRYDLVIIDPPTFSSANARRGIRAWNAERDLGPLVRQSAGILEPGGVVFVSTNAGALASTQRLKRYIADALRRSPRWIETPPAPEDFPGPLERAAWTMFSPN
jgi:23S rRNA (cytosine1962-C5)-methyltransferase